LAFERLAGAYQNPVLDIIYRYLGDWYAAGGVLEAVSGRAGLQREGETLNVVPQNGRPP
jgi:hypothetical protein